ncbi:unnamed protein product [Haemonchus placei]|uniref:Origin recognition complex subunit 5 n=1 Tax=Haemonchus placei TaxID=6290 RepID=A0A158QQR5_HAEPC|nr:unnamed protein product [Haemonchus placei]
MRSDSVHKLHALLSQWTSITHIHCYGIEEADVLDDIREELELLQKKDKHSFYVIINCFLVDGSIKRLIDELLRELKLQHDGKVNTINALAVFLGEHLFSAKNRVKLTIVLDQARFLSLFPVSTVKTLLSIPKSIGIICPNLRNDPLIRFVTHSELPWDRIGLLNVIPQPVSVGLENRSEEECIDEIAEAFKEDYSRKIVDYVVKAVFFECRDVQRIMQIVRLACEKYSEKHGDVNDIKNLKLLPVLEALDETDCYWKDENEPEQLVDLPLSTRYLLVASFCASHNPSSTDKRYFAKFHGKEKRSEARERRAEQSAEQRDGEAKSADLQRIKCIYLALCSLYPAKGIDMNVDVNPQIASLCSCGSVARTTSAANLDQPKFRCLESFENISEIAQSLGIPLTTYLDGWT